MTDTTPDPDSNPFSDYSEEQAAAMLARINADDASDYVRSLAKRTGWLTNGRPGEAMVSDDEQ
jgi:hypothetical protein